MPPSTPEIIDLANGILKDTEKLLQYFQSNGYPLPTFTVGSASRTPETEEYAAIQESLLASLKDLQYLIEGPKQTISTFLRLHHDLGAFQVAFEFDFFRLIPSEGDINLAQLAQKAGLDEDIVCRLLRMLTTNRIFAENKPGHFSHTPLSILFNQDEEIRCIGEYVMDEFFPASAKFSSCLRRFPKAHDNLKCPFSICHGTSLWNFYGQHPDRGARFAKALAGWTKLDRKVDMIGGFPWDKLHGKVLDVGGGSGHVSIALAHEFPDLEFIVQDKSQNVLAQGRKMMAQEEQKKIEGRVTFMQHDFFQPQTVHDVSAVLLRQVTHNWTDEQVVTIFKGIVPSLENSKSGTPLLINDTVLPEPGELSIYAERPLRNLDLVMFTCLGSKQRTRAQFETLLKEADERYNVCNVYKNGTMGIVEVHIGV
ncbi:O-methyltransferase [Annulohypoxylon nitens]|nr:O-methyltransferase [Annulohypoxylon nitens]